MFLLSVQCTALAAHWKDYKSGYKYLRMSYVDVDVDVRQVGVVTIKHAVVSDSNSMIGLFPSVC